ncbi:MAG: DUF721 domain-containing protein [Trueperaceae bacterium]|nr:DUF721 domain-containing protein [Trueperaceae bacterium]
MSRERSVGDLLHEVFRRGGLIRGVQRAEAVLLWPSVVGAEVARFSTAVGLRNGTLLVEVPDPETALHLGMQRHHVLAAYRERLGPGAVRELRFRVGRTRAEREPPAPPPPVPIDPDAVAALARGLADIDEGLAGPALRAGKALLGLRARRVADGWLPCKVCAGLREPPDDALAVPSIARRAVAAWGVDLDVDAWCSTCRRHAGAPKVMRCAERLCTRPDDPCAILTDEERAVAVRLALARLEAVARELLPAVLGDPSLRTQLEVIARTAGALAHGLPSAAVTPLHLVGVVDDRVVRALGGAWGDGAESPPPRPEEIE